MLTVSNSLHDVQPFSIRIFWTAVPTMLDDYNRGKNTSLVMSHFYSNLKAYEAKKESKSRKILFQSRNNHHNGQEKNHNLITVGVFLVTMVNIQMEQQILSLVVYLLNNFHKLLLFLSHFYCYLNIVIDIKRVQVNV